MYVAVDIGGTKTLVAVFNEQGEIARQHKFATPKEYKDFLEELAGAKAALKSDDVKAVGVAVPGRLNREKGTLVKLGNLPWRDQPIRRDIKAIFNAPTTIENDAKLAGLSEAELVINDYKRVLYITISTGIGTGFITNGRITRILQDMEGGRLLVPDEDGKLVRWESMASGSAIHKQYDRLAHDIPAGDPAWDAIAAQLAIGLFDLIAILEPEVVIVGGGVGGYLPRFQAPLLKALKVYETPMVPIPRILQAQRPEEAVIYGCFSLINEEWREHYG